MDNLSQKLAEIAASAAQKVGGMLTDAFTHGVASEEKSAHYDLVTEYDRASERMIVEHILAAHPDSAVMGEEGGARGGGAVQWYIDPIDGTTNFATGIPFFCVSIGAVLDNRVMAGVIYDPIRHELFTAFNQGAFLNGHPIAARGQATDANAVLLTAFPSPGANTTAADYLLFGELVQRFRAVRRLGSAALALAYVACGRADVAMEPGINPWDVTAGLFLLEQAGGRYLAFGGPESQPARPVWLYPRFIATCPEFELEQSTLAAFLKPQATV